MEKKLSIREAFKYGINSIVDHITFFLGLGAINGLLLLVGVLILIIIGVLIALLIYQFIPSECDIPLALFGQNEDDPRGIICLAGIWSIVRGSTLVFSVIREFFLLGWIKAVLEFFDTGSSSYRTLFSMGRRLFKAMLASCVYYLLVGIGLFCFIVPGIYLAIRYYFYRFVIVDQNVSFLDAFKKSSELSSGVFWKLFGFGLLVLIINFAGMLAFGLGWIITYPITLLAQAYVYRKLQSQTGERIVT